MKTSLLATALLAATAFTASSHAQIGWAVTLDRQLIRFDVSAPALTLSAQAITGLVQTDGATPDAFGNLLDLAAYDGRLYGLDGHANVYSLDAATGAATFLSNAFAPLGFDGGLAFDVSAGQFRFVSDAAENVLIAPDGTLTYGNTLSYAASDPFSALTPVFTALAFTPAGTAFALDPTTDTLATATSADFETFFTVGALGLDFTGLSSLDSADGRLFAALSEDFASSALYTIDAATGAATRIDSFGTGITALAFIPAPTSTAVPEPSTYGLFGAGMLVALLCMKRRKSSPRAQA